jgi:hypothetical protein
MAFLAIPQWFPHVSLYTIFLGLSSCLYFSRGEFDKMVWKPLLVLSLLHPVSMLAVMSTGCGVLKSLMLVFMLDLSYFLPLFFSIALYRLCFHRLRRFPGPFWARLSMFWRIKQIASQNHYILVDNLHKKYGDVVRIGE